MNPKQPTALAGVSRAKRLFLANLTLFVCLLMAAWFLSRGDADGDASGEAEVPAEKPSEELPSLPELAYLRGQFDALSEHPKTMPPFEESWVRHVSRKQLLHDPIFANQSEWKIELLADEYYRGYSERFDEYFDTTEARRMGREAGLELGQSISPRFTRASVMRTHLEKQKKALMAKYAELDTPERLLFKKAYDAGFQDGYDSVKNVD
ncbi:MAG: hypothetical protein GVY36_06320 [Verrucomicrobia bacterium]|jgi:hypothetical protein|nr:hypothetical protein [Verrucomicrobiota bacterium]